MDAIEVEEICVRATAGAHVHYALRESVALAMKENKTVLLQHNDNHYRIDPWDVISKIKELTQEELNG